MVGTESWNRNIAQRALLSPMESPWFLTTMKATVRIKKTHTWKSKDDVNKWVILRMRVLAFPGNLAIRLSAFELKNCGKARNISLRHGSNERDSLRSHYVRTVTQDWLYLNLLG